MARTEGDANPGPHACVSCRGDSGTRGSALQRETCRTDENTQCGWRGAVELPAATRVGTVRK